MFPDASFCSPHSEQAGITMGNYIPHQYAATTPHPGRGAPSLLSSYRSPDEMLPDQDAMFIDWLFGSDEHDDDNAHLLSPRLASSDWQPTPSRLSCMCPVMDRRDGDGPGFLLPLTSPSYPPPSFLLAVRQFPPTLRGLRSDTSALVIGLLLQHPACSLVPTLAALPVHPAPTTFCAPPCLTTTQASASAPRAKPSPKPSGLLSLIVETPWRHGPG